MIMVDGDFILREAATNSVDLRIFRALIKYGADPCLANKMGSTVLHLAAFHGRADAARILIEFNFSSLRFSPDDSEHD